MLIGQNRLRSNTFYLEKYKQGYAKICDKLVRVFVFVLKSNTAAYV